MTLFGLPLHPILVHVPLALAMLQPVVVLTVLLGIRRRWLEPSTWLLVAGLQVAMAGSGFAAMQAGEDDEDRVKKVVPEDVVETHAERAENFVWTSLAVTMLFLLPFVPKLGAWSRSLRLAALPAALVLMGMAIATGHSGGTLVYREGAAKVYPISEPKE